MQSQSVAAPVSSQAPGRLAWFVRVDPDEEWTVAAEAVGTYDITPDLQYSQSFLIYQSPEDQSQPQARPVEEADVGDFVGTFVHTDPAEELRRLPRRNSPARRRDLHRHRSVHEWIAIPAG